MSTFGRTTLEQLGRSIQVSSDGFPEFKTAGVTIDWATVAAVAGSDVTWLDNFVVKVGEKALRYGQVITKITASGKYGPYDPAAVDGRQTLARGSAYVLNESYKEDDTASDHPPGAFDGGHVFLDRILHSGGGAASLAAGPTEANLLTTFPRLILTRD